MAPALPPPDDGPLPAHPSAFVAGGPLVGVQKSYAEDGWLDSLTLGGRVYRGLVGVELGASLRLTKVQPNTLEGVLVVVGEMGSDMNTALPAPHDRGSLRLLVDVGPNRRPGASPTGLPDFDADRGAWASPHLYVGGELAAVREFTLTGLSADGSVDLGTPEDHPVPGLVVGVGLCVGRGELFGVRLVALDHVRPNPYDLDAGSDVQLDAGRVLTQHFTLALEVGLSSGGL